jgi:hypothetical protein
MEAEHHNTHIIYISGSAVFNRRCSLTGMIDIKAVARVVEVRWLMKKS